MSRQMKRFADYFMQGMQMGAGWAEKWQAQQIAAARNKIMDERYKAQDRRENTKLGLYAESVKANAELARARAHKALNPTVKGGGGGPNTQTLDEIDKTAQGLGLTLPAPAAAPAAPQVNIEAPEADSPAPAMPASEPMVGEQARGGMVRRMAEGGIVSGMSLQEAQSYGPSGSVGSSKKEKPNAMSSLAGAAANAAGKYKPEKETSKDTDVRATGPVGSGAGGSYTEADLGGVLNTSFRRGGAVRRYQEGGIAKPDPQVDVNLMIARNMAEADQPKPQGLQDIGSANAATGNTSGSVGGATAAGGGTSESSVGGTGGVGGSATGESGGSAAAGDAGGAGGTYRRGGQVRRYQSGGRVMREVTAIDTGTSGPGSGYGFQAAPPGRRY